MRRLLVISNGHGEIAIAERIVAALLADGSETARGRPFVVDHLPLVGSARDRPGFVAIGPRVAMPSGGLVAMGNVRALARDFAAGFARLFAEHVAVVRRVRYDGVVAVGDVYALAFALLVRCEPTGAYARRTPIRAPAIFVGTAKSVSVAPYGPGERRLLNRARRIFVRDEPTAAALVAAGIAAEAPGNVIVDLLGEPAAGEAADGAASGSWIAVLPGSRSSAYGDAVRLLAALREAARLGARPAGATLEAPLEIRCSIAPGLDPDRFVRELAAAGWSIGPAPGSVPAAFFLATAAGIRVSGLRGPLAPLLHGAALVLGQAGTGNEQAAAAGVPVVALAGRRRERSGGGEGWYRMRQHRLLGDALALVSPEPRAAGAELAALLGDAARLAAMSAAGRSRMGPSGGAAAIARAIRDELLDDAS